jgi:hypothetical protein
MVDRRQDERSSWEEYRKGGIDERDTRRKVLIKGRL